MSRNFNEIQQQILDARATASELNALEILTTSEKTITSATTTSKVGVWRLWVWVFAFVIWLHEKIVEKNAENSRPQNLPNFIATVLNFHDGLPLVWKDGQFQYDLTGVIDAEERKIINRCAVLESDDGEIVVKVAHDNSGNLEPITNDQATRLTAYLKQQKVPGIRVRLINEEGDLIKVSIRVYVDPLQIDLVTGQLLNSTEAIYPVKDAMDDYLASLEFNGSFVSNFFTRKIEDKEGINLVEIDLLQWSFAAFPFMDFTGWKVPESGYFKINPEDLTINYLPYVLVNN